MVLDRLSSLGIRFRWLRVFLQDLLSFGSAPLLLARRRDISPGVSLARGRAAIQSMVPPSFTAPLGAYCDCFFVLFFFYAFLRLHQGVPWV